MSDETPSPDLILASSSPHRAKLLRRLGLPFQAITPGIDEGQRPAEAPITLVARLAGEKAAIVAAAHPSAVVIGSDQVAIHQGRLVGKPGQVERAARQLSTFSGDTVQFLTAVVVMRDGGEPVGEAVIETRVEFRDLQDEEIERYLAADRPYDCAGSFRAESMGPALFESAFSQDPTAVIGLPLIETARLLRMAGFKVP